MQKTLISDLELLKRLSDGDELALKFLYDRYWQKLYEYVVYKVEWQEVAEDIVQDIFINLWNKRSELSVQKVESYLFTAAKYKIIDVIRSDLRRNYHESYHSYYSNSFQLDIDENIAYNELENAINEGLEMLPEKSREIFKLNRLEHLSVKEVAVKLNIPLRTVEYHLANALRKMQFYLKDYLIPLAYIILRDF